MLLHMLLTSQGPHTKTNKQASKQGRKHECKVQTFLDFHGQQKPFNIKVITWRSTYVESRKNGITSPLPMISFQSFTKVARNFFELFTLLHLQHWPGLYWRWNHFFSLVEILVSFFKMGHSQPLFFMFVFSIHSWNKTNVQYK